MKTVETVGCWIWYVNRVKEHTTITDYKELLNKYMASVPWETVVQEMNK